MCVAMRDHQLDDPAPGPGPAMRVIQRWSFYTPAIVIVLLIAAGATALGWNLRGVRFPNPAEVTARRVIVLQSANGRYLPAGGLVQLPPVAAQDMGKNVVDAVLSIEDRHFYRHGAIDPWSILRAAKQNFEAGEIVGGGSTITQQLVKMLFLGSERTYQRKIREAAIAIWLEHELSKNQIGSAALIIQVAGQNWLAQRRER
jgi:penicillin-binding protein 1A